MERLKHMKECLVACIQNQMNHLEEVDTKELGEAIDMLKDLEEAIYYRTITEAMHQGDWKEKYEGKNWDGNGNGSGHMYYGGSPMYYGGWPMYYSEGGRGGGSQHGGQNGSSNYDSASNGSGHSGTGTGTGNYQHSERDLDIMRDEREGKSPKSRRMYMESKQQHHDKATQMRELENYMQELTNDIVEMVNDASQEEKQYLSKRVAALANKIAQLND